MKSPDDVIKYWGGKIARNPLFCDLVTKVIDVINYVEERGYKCSFMLSYRSPGQPRERIILFPNVGDFYIAWDSLALSVEWHGKAIGEMNTEESILDYVKQQVEKA